MGRDQVRTSEGTKRNNERGPTRRDGERRAGQRVEQIEASRVESRRGMARQGEQTASQAVRQSGEQAGSQASRGDMIEIVGTGSQESRWNDKQDKKGSAEAILRESVPLRHVLRARACERRGR
ncbi:uncharacterized protein LOC143217247 [Lasioglossum baleicum]|uniref:uncharacterized protein LOC143217247 n=1 Tax=Lasioglossum baleicum TaxID=434251 RepID=UPI003FCD217E